MTKSDTRTVKVYNPRESPGGRAGWQADVADLMRLSSVPSLVLDGPPTASEYKLQQPNIDEASAAELCNAAMAEYQRYNTVLWDIIRPSVVIAGPWEEIDQDHIRDNFINGDLRDGVGLYHWASAFGDTSGLVAQLQISKDLANYDSLRVQDCSVQRVTMHLTRLLKLWRSLEGNDIQHPKGWVLKVLSTWPAEPASSLGVHLRTWLSGKITEEHASVATPAALIQAVTKHATTLGLPIIDKGALLAFQRPGGGGSATPGERNPAGQRGDQPKGRPREGKNDCTSCDSDCCNAKTTKANCIMLKVASGSLNPDDGIPNVPKTGANAFTTSELWHLKASARLSKALNGASIKGKDVSKELKKVAKKNDATPKSGATGSEKQVTPMISQAQLMD